MVNQAVLEYLRNYGKSFSLDDLKKKIVEGGYSEQDFNEAASVLGLNKPVAKISSMPGVVQNSRGTRWMRFAGILGIGFLILSALLFVASFFISSPESSNSLPVPLAIGILVFALLVFVSYLFFLKGFAKMGKYTSKLLRFSSVALIISNIAAVVLSVVAIFIVYMAIRSMINSSMSAASGLLGGITGAAVSDVSSLGTGLGGLGVFSSIGAAGWGILVTAILVAIFFVVINTLFFVGLVLSGKQIKFAKLAGVLGIVLIAVSIFVGLYIFSNPFIMLGMLLSGTATSILLVTQILIYTLSWIVLLFETLVLFDASKKFESSEY